MINGQKKEWDKLPLKNTGVAERFAMISLSRLI